MFKNICNISILLAYVMTAYCMASFFYIFKTKNIGTPLKDSYTAEQIKIKEESSNQRRKIFNNGLLLSFVVLFLLKPFKDCSTCKVDLTNLSPRLNSI